MEIVIYSKNNCVFCTKAKHLVKTLGLEYTEKKMEDFDSPQAMLEEIGKQVSTMPHIKIENKLIGVRETHRLAITVSPEQWKMGKVIKKL